MRLELREVGRQLASADAKSVIIGEMEGERLQEDVVRRYLAVLGVPRRTPTADALADLVAAHVTRVPFENISKLYYRKHLGLAGLVPIELFLDGIERRHFGGTCYANNFHFYCLLASLGYEVKLCGADMRNPDVHIVTLVALAGREYLVDTGYAAPFLVPLPRDLATDYVVRLGQDRYVLKQQDSQGRSRLELYRNGAGKHGYVVKPAPKKIEDFSAVIAESFRPDATFLNSLLLARFYPGRSLVIHNLSVTDSRDKESTICSLRDRDELVSTIEREFGIPGNIVGEAIAELGSLRDAWG